MAEIGRSMPEIDSTPAAAEFSPNFSGIKGQNPSLLERENVRI